jgi:hypothetical protein
MKALCGKCHAGPSDIGGHEDLYVHSFVGPTVVLKCRVCESFWTRRPVENRSFEWLASTGAEGILVPYGA